jgi:hypothetical protein
MKNYDRLRAALADAHISTLDDLVHHMARFERVSSGEAILLPSSGPEPAPSPDQLPAAPSIVHRFPRIPLVLDGKPLQAPEELTPYNGTPLYYTPVRDGAAVALAAFTSRNRMIADAGHLPANLSEVMAQPEFEHLCQQPPDNLPEQACFFQDVNEGGDVVCLAPARAYPDLTRVGRHKVLWWYTGDWNDVVSSVSWCRWDVSLYEHVNYGGSQLWLPAGCNTPSLVELGWNDKASAIVNWGRRF